MNGSKLSTENNPKDIEGVTIMGIYRKNKTLVIIIAAVALIAAVYFLTRNKKP